MASKTAKTVSFFLLFVFGLVLQTSAAAPKAIVKKKRSFVKREWVVKLRQNSFFNRRPFQFSSPVVEGDSVFVGIHREMFYGISIDKGRKNWKFKTQGPVHAPAAVEGGAVYFADVKGIVYALDQNSGKPLWMAKVSGPVMSAPLAANGKVYIVTLTKGLYCFDAKEGGLLWQEQVGERESGFTVKGSANPVLFGSTLLVGYSDGLLVAHSLENGKIVWTKQLGDSFSEFRDIDSTPFIVSDEAGARAYVSTADGKLFAFNPAGGDVIWDSPTGGGNNAVVADSFLYVTGGGKISCFQAKTGEILWEQDLEEAEISSPAVYKNWIVAVAAKGRAYFVDRRTGDVLNFWYVRGGSYGDPAVAGNRILILSNASKLYSFRFKE